MNIEERLAAIEEKLGINTPRNEPIMVWDYDKKDFYVYDKRYTKDGEDVASSWRFMSYIPSELWDALMKLPEIKT